MQLRNTALLQHNKALFKENLSEMFGFRVPVARAEYRSPTGSF